MKYVKMLGLAAVAAAALMAFAGASSASASVLCKTKVNANGNCPAGWGYSGEIHAVTEEPSVLTGTTSMECKESTISGNLTEGTATSTETPNGAVTVFSIGTCNCEMIMVKTGTLELHAIKDTGNGTLTSNGTELTINCSTIFGKVHCIYITSNTDLGELTGSTTTGATPTIDITAEIPQAVTSSLCSERTVWHAKYKVTTPDTLDVATATE
jgi:hypothetical protein